ncbi:MAG: CBS domain-containing protein [Terriglobales bacterium]
MRSNQLNIAAVMRATPAWCTAGQSAQVVASVMRDYSVHRVSVIEPESGRLLGTVSERDLCLSVVAGGRDPRGATAEEIMRRDPPACHPESELLQVRDLMLRERAHQLPVVDAENRLVGTVFLTDLLARTG